MSDSGHAAGATATTPMTDASVTSTAAAAAAAAPHNHDTNSSTKDSPHPSGPATIGTTVSANPDGAVTAPASTTSTTITGAENSLTSPAPAGTTAAATSHTPNDNTPGDDAHFVAPTDFLRPVNRPLPSRPAVADASAKRSRAMSALDREQVEGLRAIRAFLKVRTSYDVLPLSYRLIVFDTQLLVKRSLSIMTQCAIVSAPLWDSTTSTFAGLLTTSDYINLVQYYWQNPDALQLIDQFRLNSLREIERAIGVTPIETVSIHPDRPLYEACRRMLESRARRIPLVDTDDETKREMVVSVVTQYRILKFVSVNVPQTEHLRKPLKDIGIGTYGRLATASMQTPVMECIHLLVKLNISCVPLLDDRGILLNVFEAVDVISLIKGGDYDTNLSLTAGKALEKRSEDFPGIYTCTLNDRLGTIFDTIRKSRVHRLIVVDEDKKLRGILSLSDILGYVLNSPIEDD